MRTLIHILTPIRFLLAAGTIIIGFATIFGSTPGGIRIGLQEGWNTASFDAVIPLGFESNAFRFTRDVFMGKTVRRFRLKLRTSHPIGSSDSWITGLEVKIYAMPGQVHRQTLNWLQTQDPEGGFWTNTIPGNWARLEINTVPMGNRISVGTLGTYFHIEKAEFDWDSSIPGAYVPSSNIGSINTTEVADATIIDTHNYERTTGLMIGVNDTHYHYAILQPGFRYAVYVSPLSLALNNDVGLAVGISTSGFVALPVGTSAVPGKVVPRGGDRGVYHEIEPSASMRILYLTVSGVISHSYTLAVNRVKRRFSAVYEMSDGLADKTAPAINYDIYSGAINFINPYGWQHRNFIASGSTSPVSYLRRLREVIVVAAADMLAASEGYARFNRADIYLSEHTFLNTDVFVHQIRGRAYASPSKVNIFLDELDEPVEGGATLHHEWGHFEYGMDDEYHEPGGAISVIDHNSVMGTSGYWQNIPAFEFCTALNHVWRSNWDPTEADGESNWEIFTDKYSLVDGHNVATGQYHDVLHALRELIEFNHYE